MRKIILKKEIKMRKDKFKELAGEFMNEADVEEGFDEEGLDINEEERNHFEEDNEEEHE